MGQAPAAEVPEGVAETELEGSLLVLEGITGMLVKLLEGLGTETLPEGAGALLVGTGALPEGAGALCEGAGAPPGVAETLPDGAGALPEGAGAPPDGAGAALEGPGAGAGAGEPGAPGAEVGGQLHSLTVTVDTTVTGGPGRGAELAGAEGAGVEPGGAEPAEDCAGGTVEAGGGGATGLAPAPEQASACNWMSLH